MSFDKEVRKGVTSFGYVKNIRSFVQEANTALSPEEVEFKAWELNALIDSHVSSETVTYKNKFGKLSTTEKALYAIFPTGKKAIDGDLLVGYYSRQRVEKGWTGLQFTTEKSLAEEIKNNLMFRLGDIYFDNWQDGL